jgi:hypothetical protein
MVLDLQTFQNLPTIEIAKLVRSAGPKVCVFPINGTRRWYMLEHAELAENGSTEAYARHITRRLVEILRIFFEHGVDTVLVPLFGPELMERDKSYEQVGVQGLTSFAQNQEALDFYNAYDVRVRTYGDAKRYFQDTAYASTLPVFEQLSQHTANNQTYRLFLGLCGHDATETVAEFGARFYQEHGHLPNRRQIVEAYYGEYVEPVDFFIGSGQPAAFDMPLVATGEEDLYFTVAPSAYLDDQMLRTILYDHLYARPAEICDYSQFSANDWHHMADFYTANRHTVLGVGNQQNGNKLWTPVLQS